MKRLINKLGPQLEAKINEFNQGSKPPALSDGDGDAHEQSDDALFTAQNIYRYRFQRGVNLGSWFVLERWITDEPFKHAKAPAQSDLDVAHGPHAKEILEQHWDTWIQDEDWAFIRSHGINSARIPIGYYHLCGADRAVLDGTDFWPFYDVFQGAWTRITRAISKAAEHGLGVLLDLHAAPGKQNNDAHAGTSGRANFFGDPHNQRCTTKALEILVTHLRSFTHSFDPPLPNIIGIELLNEPAPPNNNDGVLQAWYRDAIAAVRAIDPGMPVYIADCWRPEVYAGFIERLKPSKPSNSNSSASGAGSGSGALTVIDHHLYRCFTSSDIHTSASSHTQALLNLSTGTPKQLAHASEIAGRAGGGGGSSGGSGGGSGGGGGGGLVIGEWSAAMNPGSLHGSAAEQREQQREWVSAQLDTYARVAAGWFFWTYKKKSKQWPGDVDVGWSWRDAVQAGVFPEFVGVRRRRDFVLETSNGVLERKRHQALDQHTAYWSHHPGKYDHARFAAGYTQGWRDALSFLSSQTSTRPSLSSNSVKNSLNSLTKESMIQSESASASELGFKAAWARKRTTDHGKSYWEYETGFIQAVDAAGEWYTNSL